MKFFLELKNFLDLNSSKYIPLYHYTSYCTLHKIISNKDRISMRCTEKNNFEDKTDCRWFLDSITNETRKTISQLLYNSGISYEHTDWDKIKKEFIETPIYVACFFSSNNKSREKEMWQKYAACKESKCHYDHKCIKSGCRFKLNFVYGSDFDPEYGGSRVRMNAGRNDNSSLLYFFGPVQYLNPDEINEYALRLAREYRDDFVLFINLLFCVNVLVKNPKYKSESEFRFFVVDSEGSLSNSNSEVYLYVNFLLRHQYKKGSAGANGIEYWDVSQKKYVQLLFLEEINYSGRKPAAICALKIPGLYMKEK